MVIRAQIGNSPNVGLFVLGLRLVSSVILLGHVVEAALVFLPVGVNHGSSISSAGVTLSLHVPLFLTIAAYYVGVAGSIAADRGGVHSGAGVAAGVLVAGRVIPADSSDLVNFLHANVVPGDIGGLGRGQAGFDGSDPLRSPMVVVDGLQFTGQLHAFLEAGFSSFYNLIADRILEAGQEELMLDEEGHVLDALGFNFGLCSSSRNSSPDGGHGGGLVVHKAVVGNLDPAPEIVH
jgi:hypothetical protein